MVMYNPAAWNSGTAKTPLVLDIQRGTTAPNLLGSKSLVALLAISFIHKVLPFHLPRLWYLSAIASIPCLTTMGFGNPVLPLVCRTTSGSHSASSNDLWYG